MTRRPTSISGTKRQICQNAAGQTVERAYLYLLPETWQALRGLTRTTGLPQSELIETLIRAASGHSLKDQHDTSTDRSTK
jgi:hypothetical protein